MIAELYSDDLKKSTTRMPNVVDDRVQSHHAALDLKVDESEVSAVLDGVAAKHFVPTFLILIVTATAGALNADGTLNVGTTTDGDDIASAVALTGLTAVGATRMVPLAANSNAVLGNATLYVNIEAAETGVGTLVLEAYVLGRQI
jgi:hypothetical protein